MMKKGKRYVPSDSDSDSDWLSDTSSDDDETVEVNGFHVLESQENQVQEMFKKHPDLSLNFNLKSKQLKSAYMDVLLDVIKTLCQSTKDLSLKALNKADTAILYLTRAGLKLGWLRQQLDDAYLKKEKQRASKASIKELEEQVKKRKLALSNLESDLKKEKAASLAAKARIGFRDVV